MLKKIEKVINTLEKNMLKVLFLAMTLIVLAQVLNRITVNFQMAWSEELSRYLFVWIVFIASACAAGEKLHIGVTALVDRLPTKCQRVIELISYLLCLLLSVALVYYTCIIIGVQIQYQQLSPSLRLPMQFAYAGMVVGGVFMTVHFLLHIANFFSVRDTLDEGSECT